MENGSIKGGESHMMEYMQQLKKCLWGVLITYKMLI